MAIVNCSECGGKVSTSAAACPHCGVPVEAIEIAGLVKSLTDPQERQRDSVAQPITRTGLERNADFQSAENSESHHSTSSKQSNAKTSVNNHVPHDDFRPPYQLCLALCIPMLLFQIWAWRNGHRAGTYSPTAPANIFFFAAMSTTLFFLTAVAAKNGSSGALVGFILFAIAIVATGIRTPDWNAEVQQLLRDSPEKAFGIQLQHFRDVPTGFMMTLYFGIHSFILACIPGAGFNAFAIWIDSRYLNGHSTVDQSSTIAPYASRDISRDSIALKITEDAKTAGLKILGGIAGVATWAVAHVFFFSFCYALGARSTENVSFIDSALLTLKNDNPLGFVGHMIGLVLMFAPYFAAILVYKRVQWGSWDFV